MSCRFAARSPARLRLAILLWAAMAVLGRAQANEKSENMEATPASAPTSTATISVGDAFGVISSLTWWGVDLTMEMAGYGFCPFSDDAVTAATEALQEHIRAQPLAVESISKALSSWQFSQRSGRHEPLVMALTGSTGTGKTETAWVLAEALLTKRCRISGGTKDIPRGLLVLNGGDYTMASKVEEYQTQIKRKLGLRLSYCGGNVVVLFDELQKAAAGTLDALSEAMSEHPRVTFNDGWRQVSVDSSRVIFLLVSDVGAEGVNAAVLRFKKRSDVVPGTLQSAVKRALDDQWERLRFGKMVDKVIPYLPMDPVSNLLVIELKLDKLAETLEGGLYTTSDLRWHLVQPRYIQYSTYHVKPDAAGGKDAIRHDLAVYGARDAEKESMRRIKGSLREHVFTSPSDAPGRGQGGEGVRVPGDRAEDAGYSRRCWEGPFMVDIRYDTSTDQVSFHRCAPDYADGLTELQREHPSAVQGPKCELAWRGIFHDHGALK